MIFLEQNIKGLCVKNGLDFNSFIADFNVDNVGELELLEIETIAEEFEIDIQSLLFTPLFEIPAIKEKLNCIKFLILDVDGVMTDAGMYYTENGDQMKKFNSKDGIGIMHLQKNGIRVGIISSGFYGEAIKKRASVLGVELCYVGVEPKLDILKNWCAKLDIKLNEVAMIGDDINDLALMQEIGFSACPSDAHRKIKSFVDLILTTKGGSGCVREFIDNYLIIEK